MNRPVIWLVLCLMALPPCVSKVFPDTNGQGLIKAFQAEKNRVNQNKILRQMKNERNPVFNPFYLDIVKGGSPFSQKRIALEALEINSWGQEPELATKLMEILRKEKNDLVIEGGIDLLSVVGVANQPSFLTGYFGNPDVFIRLSAIKALYRFGNSETMPAVTNLVAHETNSGQESRMIRKYAMLIIARYGGPSSTAQMEKVFQTALKKTNEDETMYSVVAIRKIDNQKASDLVMKNTNRIRNQAVKDNLVVLSRLRNDKSWNDDLLDYEPGQIKGNVADKGETLRQITSLSNRIADIKRVSPKDSEMKGYYNQLGDLYYAVGMLRMRLSDSKRAKEDFHLSDDAYNKALGTGGK